MALMQIVEPGTAGVQTPRRVVGIDLGTTHSLVATVRAGRVEVLADAQGRVLLPSVVHYPAAGERGEDTAAPISPAKEGSAGQGVSLAKSALPTKGAPFTKGVLPARGVLVGEAARAVQGSDPANTLASVKRLMGRRLADLPTGHAYPWRIIEQAGGLALETRAGPQTPVAVSAEILRSLRARAENALGGDLLGAVITVPAYFDDAQRQATRDAAQLAGLHVLRLLNEPTAAALAYGLDMTSDTALAAPRHYVIYDLGGGTFDVSVLRFTRGVFEVLATQGNPMLGGDDFDQALYHHLLAQIPGSPQLGDPREMQRLLGEARACKEALSTHPAIEITLSLCGTPQRWAVQQAEFQQLTQPLVDATLTPLRRALRDARLRVEDIAEVVLVGGATRMLHVRQTVQAFFGRVPLCTLDPDQVVAIGAAQQADLLAGNRSTGDAGGWLLLDVTPLSLGIETMGGLSEKVIPRNSTIPIARAQEFTTFRDGQTALALHIVQGERERVSDCRSLARFELRGIPPMVAGAARIRVVFQVDADGILHVSASETQGGAHAEVSVKPSYGLEESEITAMLHAARQYAQEDMQARRLSEAQVEGECLLQATAAALEKDAALLHAAERTAIDAALVALRAALIASQPPPSAGPSADAHVTGVAPANVPTASLITAGTAILKAIQLLQQVTVEFAARRMDAAVQQGLRGRTLQSLE